ncbi:MAG: RSP_2648 family PIN domain-containing protein [Paracoccaceae bacterium]
MKRVLLDACVLYPTVTREMLLGAAARGLFCPLWSARILDEWARAVAAKLPDEAEVARVEIALLRSRWPHAEVPPSAALEAQLFLPDPDDCHVLAAAITGRAETLVTLNRADFPTRTLAAHDMRRLAPDPFLLGLWLDHRGEMAAVADAVHARASELAGADLSLRGLLKKARLPRLGKALARAPLASVGRSL